MYELPLFPLKTVLFPGTPLNLHIFEERYLEMINMCVEDERLFGVNLIRRGVEARGPLAKVFPVGCSARIIQVERKDNGHMNIVALGQDRYRLHTADRESYPYLVGMVEDAQVPPPILGEANRAVESLRRQIRRYVKILIEAGNVEFDTRQLPDEPLAVAYMGSAILQLSMASKQALLSIDSADELIAETRNHFRREVALLDVTLSPRSIEMPGGFSIN